MLIRDKWADYENHTRYVLIICPICRTKRRLSIPIKIIDRSKRLTVVSVPVGLVCKHNFQAFIDKDFAARGYQKVDFEFSKMEFYEGSFESANDESISEKEAKEDLTSLSSLPIFQDIIDLLRNYVDDKEIIGCALFTLNGKVLYSSLPLSTLHETIRELEVRNKKNLTPVEKFYLVLANKHKIFSQFIDFGGLSLIITLIFSDTVRLGMGDLLLRDLIKQIHEMN